MTDDQWARMWRKWLALPARVKARYLRMTQARNSRAPLPF